MADGVSRPGFSGGELMQLITDATADVKSKLTIMKTQGSNISIADMFEMQMLMNHLSQLSEMAAGVVAAANAAIQTSARNIK